MIIDSTYFINEIFIAGQANSVDVNSSRSKLSGFIAKYESRYLTEILGKDLYSDFKAGLESDPVPQKWIDLRDALANDATKESPIANYVYYWFLRSQTTTTTGIGETKQLSENADRASSIDKQVRAWNEMVDLNFEVLGFLNDNIIDYPLYYPNGPVYYFRPDYRFRCYSLRLFEYQNTLNL